MSDERAQAQMDVPQYIDNLATRPKRAGYEKQLTIVAAFIRDRAEKITSLRTSLAESEEKLKVAEKSNTSYAIAKEFHDAANKILTIQLKESEEKKGVFLEARNLYFKHMKEWKERAEAAEANCVALREALEPFALVGELKNNDYWNEPDNSDYLLYSTINIIRGKSVEIRVIDTLIAHETFSIDHPGADLLAEKKVMEEALENVRECSQGIMPIHENMDDLRDTIIRLKDARWTRLFAIYAEARAALPGGKGEG